MATMMRRNMLSLAPSLAIKLVVVIDCCPPIYIKIGLLTLLTFTENNEL